MTLSGVGEAVKTYVALTTFWARKLIANRTNTDDQPVTAERRQPHPEVSLQREVRYWPIFRIVSATRWIWLSVILEPDGRQMPRLNKSSETDLLPCG